MATASVTNTFTNGTTADATEVNTNFNDLVTFVNGSVLHLDGSKTMTGALAMGSQKITGLADPTADTEAATRKVADTGTFVFTQAGALAVGTGATRLYLPFGITIIEVEAAVGTAPTGASILVDVNVDGTTIFTTPSNRPEIAVSTFVDPATTIEDATHTDGQYLTVDIDQVGSTITGSDLVVVIRYRRT